MQGKHRRGSWNLIKTPKLKTRSRTEERRELSRVGEEDEHRMAGSSGAQLGLTRRADSFSMVGCSRGQVRTTTRVVGVLLKSGSFEAGRSGWLGLTWAELVGVTLRLKEVGVER